jgi:hypothetical protein
MYSGSSNPGLSGNCSVNVLERGVVAGAENAKRLYKVVLRVLKKTEEAATRARGTSGHRRDERPFRER